MRLFTIGFTQKTAERFFGLLRSAGVLRVIDTRLNNRSQLAGFSKADDLPFFLRELGGIAYEHRPEMAPTQEMLDRYKKQRGSWSAYEDEFKDLIRARAIERRLQVADLENAVLLCSEHEPTHCHRRLVAEYFTQYWPELEIVHLV